MSCFTRMISVLSLAGALLPAAAYAATTSHEVSLNSAQVSVVSSSRVVVTMAAGGEDLKGLITLTLDRDAATGAVTGEWSLVVRYAEYLDADGNVIDEHHAAHGDDELDPNHKERLRLVNRGTLTGQVTSGAVAISADGVVTGLDGLVLAITTGSEEFAGVTGDAAGSASALNDSQASSGTLTLTF
jgi:hypothetical protein